MSEIIYVLFDLSYLILAIVLQDGHYYPHFIGDKTEAQEF